MTSPITRSPSPIPFIPKVAAARYSISDEDVPVRHTETKPKDHGELSLDERMNAKKFLLTALKAESKDPQNPITLHFYAPFFLYLLRELLHNGNTPSLKIFDTFLFIGSGVTSCINTQVEPSDCDILVRRHMLIDASLCKSPLELNKHIKAQLDFVRNQVEEVGRIIYNAHDPVKPLDIVGIYRTFITKSYYHNEEIKKGEPRNNRWGMVRFGDKLEIKYEIIVSIVSEGKIIETYTGFKAPYGCIAQDLSIILDPLLDTFNEDTKTFDFDTCKVPIFSMDHRIQDVKSEISTNRISDDHIDGHKFLAFLRKFTFSPSLIDTPFFEKVFKDFIGLVPVGDMCKQVYSQLKEKVATQRMGTLFCLLNISYMASRINAVNKNEIEASLAILAKDFLTRPGLELEQKHFFYWEFCKFIFLLSAKEEICGDIISLKQYDSSTYQLLLPSSLLDTCLLFFKKWQQFSSSYSSHSLLKLAKEMLPQLRLDRFKSDYALLNHIAKKMRDQLSPQEQIIFLHYLQFNCGEILERGELKYKLIGFGRYFNSLPDDMKQALLPCNIRKESIEKIIRSIFLTQDPQLAKLGVTLLIQNSPYDRFRTLKSVILLAFEFPWDDSIPLESFLNTLCPEDMARELSTLLKISDFEQRVKSTIMACARSSHLECKTLSTELFQFQSNEQRSSSQNFIKDKKLSFFMHLIALELKLNPFTLDNALIELERLDPLLFSEEERTYIHKIFSVFILNLIPISDRSQLNNLITLCTLLLQLGNDSSDRLICLELSKKAFQCKEFVFELVPFLARYGFLNDTEIAAQIKEIIRKKLQPHEATRLLLLIKSFGFNPLFEFLSLRLLAQESSGGFSKLYLELSTSINEEQKIQLFKDKLEKVIENKNLSFGLCLMDLLVKNQSKSLLEDPIVTKHVISLLILFTQTVHNAFHSEGTKVKQDIIITYRKTASYLAFLASRGMFLDEIIEILINLWTLPKNEYSDTTENLLEYISKMPRGSNFLFLKMVKSSFINKDVSVCAFIEKKIEIYTDQQILKTEELEAIFVSYLKFYSERNDPLEMERLFYKILDKKIFHTHTPLELWLMLIYLPLQTLINKKSTVPETSKEYAELKAKISQMVNHIFTHSMLKFTLSQLTVYQLVDPFLYLIEEGCAQNKCQEVFLMANFLLLAWTGSILSEEYTEGLISSLRYICFSPSCFTFSPIQSSSTLFLKYIQAGVFKDREDELLQVCTLLFQNPIHFGFGSSLDEGINTIEFESTIPYIKESYKVFHRVTSDRKFYLKIIQNAPWILSQMIVQQICASYYEHSFFDTATQMIRRIFEQDVTPKDISALRYIMACAIHEGSQIFIKRNLGIPLVYLEEIIKLIEFNAHEQICIEDCIVSKSIYEFYQNFIQNLAIQSEFDLIPKALQLLFSVQTRYPLHLSECVVNILKVTSRLSNCKMVNIEIFLKTQEKNFTISREQIEILIDLKLARQDEKILAPLISIDFPSTFIPQECIKLRDLEPSLNALFTQILKFYCNTATVRRQHVLFLTSKPEILKNFAMLKENCLILLAKSSELNTQKLVEILDRYYKKLNSFDVASEYLPAKYALITSAEIEHATYCFLREISPTFAPLMSRRLFGDFILEKETISTEEFHRLMNSILSGYNTWAKEGMQKYIATAEQEQH